MFFPYVFLEMHDMNKELCNAKDPLAQMRVI